ncbi:MAG: ABC transporter permease [Planctomycetota bacterium]|nr:MAG: ABC transporter permease [Planctomycetota bacterium]
MLFKLTTVRAWLNELGEQKGRTFGTLFGVAWGSFAMLAMLSTSAGIRVKLSEEGQALGRDIVIVWPQRTSKAFQGMPSGRYLTLDREDVKVLRGLPALEALSEEFTRFETLQRGQRVVQAGVSGVAPEFGPLRNLKAQAGGRFLHARDLEENRRVAFLGPELAKLLFEQSDPIGGRFQLNQVSFTVVGVAQSKKQSSDYSGLDAYRICIPATTFTQVFQTRFVSNLVLKAPTSGQVPELLDQLYQRLGQRLKFDPGDRQALYIWDTTQDQKLRDYIFLAVDLLIGLAGAFTLFVGGLGVGNFMYLSTKRRTREFGIQLAIGAEPAWIRKDVLVQSLALMLFGGGLGAALASIWIGVLRAGPWVETLGSPQLSPWLATGVTLLLILSGLTAAWFPARKASRLDPVEALRTS